jgi:hypothetical protein
VIISSVSAASFPARRIPATLAELADDAALAERAAAFGDLVLYDLALHHHRGNMGVTHGRSYMKDKSRAADQPVFGACKLCFDATTEPWPVDDGDTVIILSDRGIDARLAAIPSLLALSAVQQRLVSEGLRTHVGLVIEAADVREVHHVACLLGFGAAAVNPWLAVDTVKGLAARDQYQQIYLDCLN